MRRTGVVAALALGSALGGAGLVLATGLTGWTTSTAYAVGTVSPMPAAASGGAGYCKDDTGVTVVVDFTELGGDIVVRCAPGPVKPGYSGLDALQGAGFGVSGTQRWGLAFVCRIQGRPSADESLSTDGNPDYHERCVDTPPSSAYWGYWYARNGGAWSYSNAGPKNRDAIKGGFEGWSFSLNHSAGSNPPPGVAPNRPVSTTPSSPSTSGPSSPGSTTGPGSSTTDAPGATGPRHAGPGGSGPGGSATSGSTSDGPGGATKSSADGEKNQRRGSHDGRAERVPEAGVTTAPAGTTPSDADDTSRVTGELPSDPTAGSSDGGSGIGTLWGVGLLAVLAGGAGVAAWRRSHRA